MLSLMVQYTHVSINYHTNEVSLCVNVSVSMYDDNDDTFQSAYEIL